MTADTAQSEANTPLSDAEQAQLIRNGEILLTLYRARTRQQPTFAWESYGEGCLARMAYSLRTILLLENDGPDVAVLTRSLFEHGVEFAWLMKAPELHFPRLLKSSCTEALKLCRAIERFGSSVNEDDVLRMHTGMADKGAPKLDQQAQISQEYWQSEIPSWEWGFERTYANLFRTYSKFVHPSVPGINVFIDSTGRGKDAPVDDALGCVRASAVSIFADALVVSSCAFKTPSYETIQTGFTWRLVDEDSS